MNTVLGCIKHVHKDHFDDENACSGGCKSIYGPLIGADSLENYIFENKAALARVKDLKLLIQNQANEIDKIYDKLVTMNRELLGQTDLEAIQKEIDKKVSKEEFDDAMHTIEFSLGSLTNRINKLELYHEVGSDVSADING